MKTLRMTILLLINCAAPVALNAMSQAETITRNFINNAQYLSPQENVEQVENGDIGIETGQKLTILLNLRWKDDKQTTKDRITGQIINSALKIKKMTQEKKEDREIVKQTIEYVSLIRKMINHYYEEYKNGKLNHELINPTPSRP